MSGGFEALGLMPELLKSVAELGWTLPTGVQDEAIPLILGGGDVMVASETGTGKTAAFCLPILQIVHERLREIEVKETPEHMTGPFDVKVDSQRGASLVVTENGLKCSSSDPRAWSGARANYGVTAGKYYYEVLIQGNGVCRLGWSSTSANLELGKDFYGYGYGGTGKISNDNKFDEYGEKFGNSDTIGCFLDWEKRTISYSKNGSSLGTAFTLPQNLNGTTLFPAVAVQNASLTFNFSGNIPFKSHVEDDLLGIFSTLTEAASEDIVHETSKAAFYVEGKRTPLAIIIEPAKELAEQVFQNLEDMAKHLNDPELKILLLTGGGNPQKLSNSLQSGADIVVGTPAVFLSLVEDRTLDLSQIRFYVLDEADALVSGSFYDTTLRIFDRCPSGGSGDNRLQVCFFSATLHSPAITQLASKICDKPTWVDLKGASAVPDSVHHVVYRVDPLLDYNMVLSANALIGDSFHGIKSYTDKVHLDEKTEKDHGFSPKTKKVKILDKTENIKMAENKEKSVIKEQDGSDTDKNKDRNKNRNRNKSKSNKNDGKNSDAADSSSGPSSVPLPIEEEEEKIEDKVVLDSATASDRTKQTKLLVLLRILKKFEMTQCMIFCRTNVDCNNLEKFLKNAGDVGSDVPLSGKNSVAKKSLFSCCVLAGQKSVQDRARNLEAFKDGQVQFLICTDLAARGIDVKGLPYVINMTLPDETDTYFHRIGRVGRAGTSGLAISIIAGDDVKEQVWFHTCNKKGDSCSNRSLTSKGGCTIWQDENEMLRLVEEKLEMTIPTLDRNFDLPACLTDLGTVYGDKMKEIEESEATKVHREDLKVIIDKLVEMENNAQRNFLFAFSDIVC